MERPSWQPEKALSSGQEPSVVAVALASPLATLAGPVGWAVVRCNKKDHNGDSGYTWDCWKPVVIDDSVGLSRGITLRDFYNYPNLKKMTVDGNDFVTENTRGEQFCLSLVEVKGTLAFYVALI